MTRVLRAAFVAVAMIAALAFAAGCGNDEQNDYVDQVNDAQQSFLDEMTAAASQASPTNASQADQLIGDMQGAIDSFVSDLEGIDAPEEVADLHDELITTMSDIGAQIGELGDALTSGNPQQAAQAAAQLTTAVSSAQTEVTSIIDQINAEFGN
jgi:hypothetical protein